MSTPNIWAAEEAHRQTGKIAKEIKEENYNKLRAEVSASIQKAIEAGEYETSVSLKHLLPTALSQSTLRSSLYSVITEVEVMLKSLGYKTEVTHEAMRVRWS